MSWESHAKEKTDRALQRTIKEILTKKENVTVSQWAERNRILDDSSNISGHWSNDITPYLVDIMDAMNDPEIREIYFCKASQVGGTEALINMLCYLIAEEPAPTMIVYPSDDLAKDISTDKLKPAFRLIPQIRDIFYETSSKELRLKFKTMTLYLRGAGSPAKLASKAIKYLFFDEIDKMGGASKKEASPFNLAKERVKTYRGQSKIYACSTPTLRTNYIWTLCDEADEVKHYFVPCPHCGELIELKWSQIKFCADDEGEMSPYDRAQTSVYVCQECGCEITDNQKPAMLRAGKWQTVQRRGVGKAKTVGYWLSSLYSIFLTWADIAEEFLKSKDDPEMLQNFTNSWLAEPWEDTSLKTSENLVLDRQTHIEEFVVPDWAKLLTGGVDVQENSFYYSIRAWGDHITSQNICHGQVAGFNDIANIMNAEFLTESGEPRVVNLCLIDSGYDADSTYDFCVDNGPWALPCKGASNPMLNHYKISKVNNAMSRAYGMQLIIVDGGKYKDMIASRMRKENGTGSWMVYQGCDEEYAKQVTGEHKVNVRKGNRTSLRWVPKTTRPHNHYLDTEVYAMCAADMLGVRTLHLQTESEDEPPVQPVVEEPTPEESWIRQNDNWLGG